MGTQQEAERAAVMLGSAKWKLIYKQVVVYALTRHRLSPDAARQVSQEAIGVLFALGTRDPSALLRELCRRPKRKRPPTTDVEAWEVLLSLYDDVLEPDYPESLLDEELRERGLDPDAVGAEGEAFVRQLTTEPS